MKRINKKDINTVDYWDKNIAEPEFGLRQEEYIKMAGHGDAIIELGCGMSPFLDKVRKNFNTAIGLDFSIKTVREALKKFPQVQYKVGDALKTGYKDNSFDVVVAGELIEHLEDPQALLDEMKRIGKKKIILSTAIMEYNDPEHLWEFSEGDFPDSYTIRSTKFPGRSYLFIDIEL